jgi:hypothetical protein
MDYIIIDNKKYEIKKFGKGGYNAGYIDFDKDKIGKIIVLSEKRKNNTTLDTDDYNENPYREVEIFKECNKIIKSKITTNLVQFYGYHIYNNYIILIMDKYDGDLNSIIDNLTVDELWSIFFQIFFTFIILQDKLGFFQGDFKLDNILYKKINKNTKYFYYKYGGKKFKVPNQGYKVSISDYGNAIINKFILADYEKEYYFEYISKRIELYDILRLIIKYMSKMKLNNYFQYKLKLIQNIIDHYVKFNRYSLLSLLGIFIINAQLTKPANPSLFLETIYKDFIYD